MALQVPVSSPLTDSQAELTSKIGSMKSLLALPIDIHLTIPKDKQISTFDYLLKVLRALGIEPELIFNIFLDKVFDAAGNFLEDKVIAAIADSIGQKGRDLANGINNPSATQKEKDGYKKNNLAYIVGLLPGPTFTQAIKQQIAKNLTLMIFGPKDGPAATVLNSDPLERERLIKESVCGINLFSLSSDPVVRQEDVEYNRVKLKQQLEKGEVVFEVSCQHVKVILPADPGYIFGEGGLFTASSTLPPTPSQSLNILVQHVKNTGQRINNEENSNSIGHSFFEIMIGKLLNYISSLVFPFLGPIFAAVNTSSVGGDLNPSNVAYSNCDIMNTANDSSQNPEEKQEFLRSLANALLKELLRFLLVFAIKEFKKLIANYFTRTAIERQKRKSAKIKQKFGIFESAGAALETAGKAKKYAVAAATLATILEST